MIRKRVVKRNVGKSKTQQQFKDQVNINNIVRRCHKTGIHTIQQGATFGNFESVGSYQECLDRVLNAQDEFQRLPSELRSRFKNNPANLIEFMLDENNRDEAVELGIIEKVEKVEEPTIKDVVDAVKEGFAQADTEKAAAEK